ncbi:Fungal-trans domain-containing protein [Mycena kentingensis (nom. inval.)]|nr:Fungal-trans domain-containing protein [Mycena kentingensis (nom. inval.)]
MIRGRTLQSSATSSRDDAQRPIPCLQLRTDGLSPQQTEAQSYNCSKLRRVQTPQAEALTFTVTTGKGNRFVLANTEVLHEKITELSNRVRQLEDGLQASHALHSAQAHPLLTPDLLAIKRPLERERPDAPAKQETNESPTDGVEAMGSLSISDGGRSTFFGQAANSWYLLKARIQNGPNKAQSPETNSIQPTDVPWIAYSFPFSASVGKTGQNIRATLFSLLPRSDVARRFSEIYYRHAAWLYTPISEDDFYDDIFHPIYDPTSAYEVVSSHNLSVLFMVLALGTLMDDAMPAHSAEALLLMVHYMFWDHIDAPRWVIMGLVVKLAHSIGLHRDSKRWDLGERETHKRRCLFYEIYTYDSWQSLTFGRPPSFSLAHIDTRLPHEPTKNAAGEVEMSFAAWKHAWSSECLSVVHDRVFSAQPPAYSTVLELDKKVRSYPIPVNLRVPGFGGARSILEPDTAPISLTLQRYCALSIKEIALFYMHRGFFAQAVDESPNDPLSSKFNPSVLAAYNGACTFVGLIESLFKQQPVLTERTFFLLTHGFSCAIVLGSIAVKPQMAISRSALSHLDSACTIFENVTDHARTAKILPILHKLRARAHEAMVPNPRILDPIYSRSPPKVKTEMDEEIAGLGGATRLITRRTTSPSSPSNSDPSSQPTSPSPALAMDSPHSWTAYGQLQQPQQPQEYTYPQYALASSPQSYDEYYTFSSYPSPEELATMPMVADLNYSWTSFVANFKG